MCSEMFWEHTSTHTHTIIPLFPAKQTNLPHSLSSTFSPSLAYILIGHSILVFCLLLPFPFLPPNSHSTIFPRQLLLVSLSLFLFPTTVCYDWGMSGTEESTTDIVTAPASQSEMDALLLGRIKVSFLFFSLFFLFFLFHFWALIRKKYGSKKVYKRQPSSSSPPDASRHHNFNYSYLWFHSRQHFNCSNNLQLRTRFNSG